MSGSYGVPRHSVGILQPVGNGCCRLVCQSLSWNVLNTINRANEGRPCCSSENFEDGFFQNNKAFPRANAERKGVASIHQ
jgi:hypothetical protein